MPETMRPLYPYAEPKNPHMIYMDMLLSRVLYISYRNLLVIDLAGAIIENFAITVWRISVQTPYTISRIRLILQGLGLSANLLLEKIVSYTVLKNG